MHDLFTKIRLYSRLRKQRGAALMVMLVILIIGATAMLLHSLNSTTLRLEREQITADALAHAKEALISYAISSENTGAATARPGNFPCPDTDAPGTAAYGSEQGSCSSAGGTTIGRLPWKTLGIPELLDADGEPLWYAVSNNFRKSTSIINSDTLGTLQTYAPDGSTLLTTLGSEAVAIVFAPGRIIGTQQRSSNTDKTTASNYLDTANGFNNATSTGPFIAADKSDSFNDRLMIIRTRDFIPIIEKRVAKELISILENYRSTNGTYPYPAPFSSCKDVSCTSNPTICRGSLPYTALPTNWGGSYALPKAGVSDWFVNNYWYRLIYYSAGTNRLAMAPPGCSATLNVSGNSMAALLFMPGAPLGNVVRTYTAPKDLTLYLEDTENNNMDDTYVTPTSNSNDQLYALP